MVPLQTIFLLLVVSTLSSMSGQGGPWPQMSPPMGLLMLLAAHVGLLIFVWMRARGAVRALHMPAMSTTAIAMGMDQVMGRARWATLLITASVLISSPVVGAVRGWLGHMAVLRNVAGLAEVLLALPAAMTWVGFWVSSYFVEVASRERSLPYRLAQNLPAHEMPGLGQYLSMQCRHNFYVVVPVLVHAMIVGLGGVLERWIPHAQDIAAPVGLVLVLMMAPWLLVRIWSTVPLTGALRARLDGVATAHGLRFTNILLWRTHNAVTNAAILGWVPWSRYFLMTDALIESLTDRQLEAVFAHEVGHGIHRHMLWYLFAFFGATTLAMGVSLCWIHWMPAPMNTFAGREDDTVALLTMTGMAVFLGVVFSRISHRFEHQADYFASRHMARAIEKEPLEAAGVDAQVLTGGELALSALPTAAEVVTLEQYVAGAYPHAAGQEQVDTQPVPGAVTVSGAPVRPATQPLTAAQLGAEVFVSALDTIIDLAHRSRRRRGWMHPSIEQRIALLRRLAVDPMASKSFERKMVRTRLMICGFVVVGMSLGALGIYIDAKAPTPGQAAGADVQTAEQQGTH